MSYNTSDVTASVAAVDEPIELPRWARLSVYASLGAMAFSAVLGVAYFAVGGIWGPLSDLGGLASGMTVLAVAWVVHRLNRSAAPRASAFVLGAGTLASVATIVGSAALVLWALGVEIAPPDIALATQFIGGGLLGLWLLGVGWLGLRTKSVETHISLAALLAGLGLVGFPVSAATVGFQNPLLSLSLTVGLLSFLLWAFWFARALSPHSAESGGPDRDPVV